jgi:23S rRNA pseudouridine2605 synthase
MRDRPHRTPRLDWPGGIVPEWAKAPASAKRRAGKKGPGGKAAGKRERLQKVMAQSGYGSRRNVEILIAQGHLTINGQLAKLGDQVGPGDRVKLDGKLIHLRFGEQLPRVLLYHKPEGEICTRDDPEGRPTVFDKLPRLSNSRWVSVGRLDFNTSGLLLFTTSGDLANRLMHPRFEVEREYAVRLMGQLTAEQFALLAGEGVDIDGEKCRFDRIEDRGGEGSNHWYHVVLREGKNREVRRMFEALGLMVSRLMRVRYGTVELPAFLKRGMSRDLAEDDVANLMAFAGMGESDETEDEEAEEDEVSGNVHTGEPEAPDPDDDYDEEDDRQPAFLMEGFIDKDDPVDELDDDRQPDFERLPGFNRATGTMGLPAGHRGVHWASGEKPAESGAAGKRGRGNKLRGKKAGGKPGGKGPGPMQARADRQPGQAMPRGDRQPGQGAPRAERQPQQGAGLPGGPQAPGKNNKRRRRGKGGGLPGAPRPVQGQPTASGAVQGGPPPAGAGAVASPTPGQGKARRGRRGRGRNRPRGGPGEGGTPGGTSREPSQGE